MLAGLVLTLAAVGLALSQVQVPGVSVSTPGASGSFSGSCSSALQVSIGTGPYGGPSYSTGEPPVLTAARATVAARCSAAATNRMRESAICLGAALLLTLAGLDINRRFGIRQRGRAYPDRGPAVWRS
jgi:hypothetical protein